MHKRLSSHSFQYTIKKAMHKIINYNNAKLMPYDVSTKQARIIGFIGRNEAEGIVTKQKDIETTMCVTGPSVTSLLQGLERKGFITRTHGANDERVKELRLTEKGKSLIEIFDSVFDETESRLIEGLSDDHKTVIQAYLDSIEDRLNG